MTQITNVVMRMQNELRNKEGITGIDAMNHINMILLSKSFDTDMCILLGIPSDLSFDNMSYLNQNDLYKKFYTHRPIHETLLYHLRLNGRFGYDKDIAFQIINASTLIIKRWIGIDKVNNKSNGSIPIYFPLNNTSAIQLFAKNNNITKKELNIKI